MTWRIVGWSVLWLAGATAALVLFWMPIVGIALGTLVTATAVLGIVLGARMRSGRTRLAWGERRGTAVVVGSSVASAVAAGILVLAAAFSGLFGMTAAPRNPWPEPAPTGSYDVPV